MEFCGSVLQRKKLEKTSLKNISGIYQAERLIASKQDADVSKTVLSRAHAFMPVALNKGIISELWNHSIILGNQISSQMERVELI